MQIRRPRCLVAISLTLACGPGSAADATATASASSSTGEPADTTTGDATNFTSTTVTPTTVTPTTVEPTSVTFTTQPTTDPTTIEPTTTIDPTFTTTTDPTLTTTSTTDPSTTTGEDSSTGEMAVLTPLSLEVGDFDGDGEQDLLVMGVDEANIVGARLSRGLGDGSFAAPIDPALTGSSAFPVVGQLDGAGGIDVLVADAPDKIQVFRWDGDAFAPWMAFTTDLAPLTHAVVDATGDGASDIVWLWFKDPSFGLSIRRSTGGGFLAPVDSPLGSMAQLGIAPGSLLVTRLDADALGDALIWEPNNAKGMLRMLAGPGGTFGAATPVLPGVRPWVALPADLDEDGAQDLVIVERMPVARLAIARGDGKGGLTIVTNTPVVAPFLPFTIAVADLDADKHLDVVAVDDKSAELRIWHGNGTTTLDAPVSKTLPSGAVRAHAAAFDANATLDLAVATFAAGDVTVLLDP